MALGDDLGLDAVQNEDTRNQLGNVEGEGLPIYELQSQEVQLYNTRIVVTLGSPVKAFILGHGRFGMLGRVDGYGYNPGSNVLGDIETGSILHQVSNYNNTFEEEFNNDRFEGFAGSTATWDTNQRRLTF